VSYPPDPILPAALAAAEDAYAENRLTGYETAWEAAYESARECYVSAGHDDTYGDERAGAVADHVCETAYAPARPER